MKCPLREQFEMPFAGLGHIKDQLLVVSDPLVRVIVAAGVSTISNMFAYFSPALAEGYIAIHACGDGAPNVKLIDT